MVSERNQDISKQLFRAASEIVPGGVHSPVRAFKSVGLEPFVVDYGAGPYLFDVDGNRYIDFVGSWGPLVLGHANKKVISAITTQLGKGSSYGACSKPEMELSQFLVDHFPSIEMIRFTSSGTEACMSALRLARGFTGRDKILKFAGCYHGHADFLLVQAGSGALTYGVPESKGVIEAVARETLTAQYNNLDSVQNIFERNPTDIAAVIVEPVVGNSGLIMPNDGFLKGLRDLCTQFGALLVFDEVMTGFRVHPKGAQGLFNITPDLTTLGKVIGGGLPVGAFGGRKEIMSMVAPIGPVYQAGTLSGNPLAMVAGLTTLKEWLSNDNFETTATETTRLIKGIESAAKDNSIPLCAKSIGTMFGFFFSDEKVEDLDGAMRSNKKFFNKFFGNCLNSGVFFAPSAFEAGFVSVAHVGTVIDETLQVVNCSMKKSCA